MHIRRILPWLGVILFLVLFFFYPMGRIFVLGLDSSALTPSSYQLTIRSLLFTTYQALLSTILTLLLGLPAAFLFARYQFRGKTLLRTLTAIPFMLPTVVVAASFNAFLGPRGWLNIGLQNMLGMESPPIVFIGTLGAILAAHVFYNTTIIIRMVSTALNRLDPRLEQTGASLGASPWRVFWQVTLPVLRPTILAASLLVFLFDFTSFGVILLLGGPQTTTLEVEIFNQALTYLNLPLAAWLSLLQLLCTLIFAILYSRLMNRPEVHLNPRQNASALPKNRRQRLLVTSLGSLLVIFYVLPLLSLPVRSFSRLESDRGDRTQVTYGFTLDYYKELFTVILSLALGYPAAAALARPGRLERFLDPILFLPLGASSITLGLGFIIVFGRLLAFPWMVPVAHTLVALPFVIRTLQPALASIPEKLKQVAVTLGALPSQVRWKVEWPIIRRAALSGMVFAFTISLGEFGATLLLYRPEYPTLPVAIYRFLSQPGGMNYGQAMAMATILMLAAGAGILLIEKLRLPGTEEF
jgi:thiamine transport system permease protein